MRRTLVVLSLALSLVTVALFSGGCDPRGGSDFTPMSDPNDDDFLLPSPPPDTGLMTWLVRANLYVNTAEPPASPVWETMGGLTTVHIDATPVSPDPRITGGVAGSRVGPFPYDRESARLPFQFPFYIAPGITVNVGATFRTILNAGEKLECWVMGAGVQEVPGTRNSVSAFDDGTTVSLDCFANLV